MFQDHINIALKSPQAKALKIEERLEKEQKLRIDPDHLDAGAIQYFPIPLVILGGQYDIFQVGYLLFKMNVHKLSMAVANSSD